MRLDTTLAFHPLGLIQESILGMKSLFGLQIPSPKVIRPYDIIGAAGQVINTRHSVRFSSTTRNLVLGNILLTQLIYGEKWESHYYSCYHVHKPNSDVTDDQIHLQGAIRYFWRHSYCG
jgi:hypothetical protein